MSQVFNDRELLHSANLALAEMLRLNNQMRADLEAIGQKLPLVSPTDSLFVATRLSSGRTIAQEVDGSRWLEITGAEANAMIDAQDHRVWSHWNQSSWAKS